MCSGSHSRFDKLNVHTALVSPLVEHPAAQVRTIIRLDHRQQSTPAIAVFQYPGYALARQ